MSNIVFEATPRRYVMETLIRDEWDPERSFNNLSEAVKVAEEWAEATGREHRVIDTQAESATDEDGLRHAVDIAFAGFRCACDACAEFEAACTARERGSEPTSKPCKSDMDTYQTASGETAIYPNTTVEQGLDYLIPALTAEAGEVAGKWAKWKRDSNNLGMTRELRDEIVTECGDVLWTLARITEDLGFSLSEVADSNIQKLQDRQQRGVLGGSGDDR